ncbi:hypothetical protein [Leptolyngbya ohadii]|uniref:hypothetical protein n=1 Tax=Leptolyngbya ohadii TaxID=1962290 RepID=UPI000B598F7A|nr:hypothetical protein [Leptolyngbya ohadii]
MVNHPITLRGLSFNGSSSAVTILERTEQEFIAATLEELAQESRQEAIDRVTAATRDTTNTLKLFQPVHRTFNLALLEVFCQAPGSPRLDPQKIDSAGLVVRRIAAGSPAGFALANVNSEQREGWMEVDRGIRGWVPFPDRAEELDPEPDRRRQISAGNEVIDRRLHLLTRGIGEVYTERVSPLFVAPPQLCQTTKRTILYGLIPVSSAEVSEATIPPTYDREFVRSHLSTYFKANDSPRSIPRADQTVFAASAKDPALGDFIRVLQQLLIELDAFGETPQATALFAQLNQISLPYSDGSTRPAGQVLKQLAQILVNQEGSAPMPSQWPPITQAQETAIVNAAKAALDARLASLMPNQGRYADPDAHYQVRAFVRVRTEEGCPPRLIWSSYSESFAIAPWYENSKAPPVQITLPNVTRATAKQFKPNVAFAVPSDLFNFIQGNDPKDVVNGEGKPGGGLDLDWICGFNIPILTFCAFIVLSLFLQLLNIVFWWLAFIKICIPFPRRS